MALVESEWLKGGMPILYLEADRGWPSPSKQRLFAVACCRRIQHHLDEDSGWQECLDVAERCADKKAKQAELRAALAAFMRSPFARPRASRSYRDLLAEFGTTTVRWACEMSRRLYAAQAAMTAAAAAAYAVMPQDDPYVPPAESVHQPRWSAAEKKEAKAQIAVVYDLCGDPFRPVTVRLGRLPREVTRLALATYEERTASEELDVARLAVLSDALEDAGCAEAELLGHLRSAGPHYRGCWAVDLILGKS
jgi:hypothetical protein